jgi:hypothetical protein
MPPSSSTTRLRGVHAGKVAWGCSRHGHRGGRARNRGAQLRPDRDWRNRVRTTIITALVAHRGAAGGRARGRRSSEKSARRIGVTWCRTAKGTEFLLNAALIGWMAAGRSADQWGGSGSSAGRAKFCLAARMVGAL